MNTKYLHAPSQDGLSVWKNTQVDKQCLTSWNSIYQSILAWRIDGTKCWQHLQGSLFLHLPSPRGQLKIRFFHLHQLSFFFIINWKISISQAFNSLLARRVRFRGITNKRIQNHLENTMFTWNNQFYIFHVRAVLIFSTKNSRIF